jgi:tripartite-type tricarboxylate transporter receptor subunit TctC
MKSRSRRVMVIALSVLLYGKWTTVYAQSNFFEGKNVRIIVGLAAGGGYDVYARMIARHMGRHIPGNPTISWKI